MMKTEIIQIVTAAIGTLGFSIYFRVNEKNVIASTIAGALGWAVYLVIFKASGELFLANFIATLFVYIYSEVAARILKAPSNIYLIPGIIPLLPGGAIYYTMYGVVSGDGTMFRENGIKTVIITIGIAAGIVVGTVIIIYFMKAQDKYKLKKTNKSKKS